MRSLQPELHELNSKSVIKLFLVPYLEKYRGKKCLYLDFLGIQDTQYIWMDSLFP